MTNARTNGSSLRAGLVGLALVTTFLTLTWAGPAALATAAADGAVDEAEETGDRCVNYGVWVGDCTSNGNNTGDQWYQHCDANTGAGAGAGAGTSGGGPEAGATAGSECNQGSKNGGQGGGQSGGQDQPELRAAPTA